MAVDKITNSETEQDLEVAINKVLRENFKWLPRTAIKHQTTFSFTFGRNEISINGLDSYKEVSARARADIILYNENQPLAVLELKRPGVSLKIDDINQGLSYARVLNPSAPLVVVTNGADTRLVETHSGNDWVCSSQPTELAFQKLITNSSKVAADNVKSAIDILMGTQPAVWRQAVHCASLEKIAELTASHNMPAFPFSKDFLIPRKITIDIINQVNRGKKLILLEGSPMAGKSNVLREIVLRATNFSYLAVLYIDMGGGRSVLQSLADMLSKSLEWQISSVEEVRTWLRRLSKANEGQKLLLALDGCDMKDRETLKEIEDLSSSHFGEDLSVLFTVNDSVAEEVFSSNGRSPSAIGRKAIRMKIEILDNQEFEVAQKVLSGHRIYLMHGAHKSFELRQPWVLRSIIGDTFSKVQQLEPGVSICLPPLFSLGLISLARKRFSDEKPRRLFQKVAISLLEDLEDQNRDTSLVLSTGEISLVRRSSLEQHMNDNDLQWLIDTGYLRSSIHESGEPVLYVGLPELLASEFALLTAKLYTQRELSPQEAADWFSSIAGNLPFGEVIVAQAILDIASKTHQLSFGLLEAFLENSPIKEPLQSGRRMLMHYSEDTQIPIRVRQDGSIEAEIEGNLHIFDAREDEFFETYANHYAWLILSHFAAIPFIVAVEGEEERFDLALLIELGAADLVLRRPSGHFEMRSLLIHDVPNIGSMVCHREGIVEPITYAILCFLGGESDTLSLKEPWIDQVIYQESMPLLVRVHIALLQLTKVTDKALSSWASSILEFKINPAFEKFPNLH